MKGLKEFLALLNEDKDLLKEVEKVQDDSAKVVEIAKKHGYEFTEDALNDAKMEIIAGGGGFLDNLVGYVKEKGPQVLQGAVEGAKNQLTSGGQQGQNSLNGYTYYQGKTGTFARGQDGSLWWQQFGSQQWTEV